MMAIADFTGLEGMLLVSQIDRAKVYAAGATVTRVASLQLEEGQIPDRVEISDLPLALDDGSVTAKIEGNATELAIATDIKVGVAIPPRPDWQEPPLETELRDAKEEVERLTDAIAIVQKEIDLLAILRMPDRPQGEKGKAPPLSPIAPRLTLSNYKSEQLASRRQEQQAIEERLRVAAEHYRDLKQRQKNASNAQQARPDELRKTVTVGLHYEGERSRFAEQQLIIEYFVPGARWTPAYVFRIDSRQNTANVAVRALICQRTGEDWTGVGLELSTAEPTAQWELPELASLRIGRAQPAPKKQGWRSPPVGVELLFADYDRDRQQRQPQNESVPQLRVPHLNPSPVLSNRIQQIESRQSLARSVPEIAEEELSAEIAEEDLEDLGAQISGRMMMAMAPPPPPMPAPSISEDKPNRLPAAPQPKKQKSRRKEYRERRNSQDSALQGQTFSRSRDLVFSDEALTDTDEFAEILTEIEETKSFAHLLSYGSLRLGKMSDRARRGKLSLMQTFELYLEVLQQQEIRVNFNLMQSIRKYTKLAEQCLNFPLPEGGSNVRQAAGSFDYAYRADGIADIPSDGQFHSVALTQANAEMEMRYVVVPREDENAFRVAVFRNPLIAPLLPGLADIYLNDEYLFSRPIDTIPPKGEVELGLGVEQGIKTARNTTYQETRSGFAMMGANRFEHRIEIEVANRLQKAAKIEVRDRLPVPKENVKKVEVEIGEVAPPWEQYEQRERNLPIEGGYCWKIELPPGDKQALSAEYIIKTGVDSELVGGNRREG
ncbi:MAG: mucoidy inhibitor MuiA family protein [Cyanobacteria bacterium P01_E01_bin.42]